MCFFLLKKSLHVYKLYVSIKSSLVFLPNFRTSSLIHGPYNPSLLRSLPQIHRYQGFIEAIHRWIQGHPSIDDDSSISLKRISKNITKMMIFLRKDLLYINKTTGRLLNGQTKIRVVHLMHEKYVYVMYLYIMYLYTYHWLVPCLQLFGKMRGVSFQAEVRWIKVLLERMDCEDPKDRLIIYTFCDWT